METKTKVISICGKNRNSTWANGAERKTTKGMKMIVEHSLGKNNKIKSTTRYV